MASQLISADGGDRGDPVREPPGGRGQDRRPARAAGQAFEEYPILTKGRLTTVEEFEEIIVRRRDDGSIVRLGDVARVELDSENYDTAGWLSGKPAGTLPIYQYSDANALDIVQQVRESMDRLAKSFPPGLEYRIAYDTTKYVQREHRRGRAHAARGVRAGPASSSSCSCRECARRSSPCWPSRSRWSRPSR